MSIDNQEPSRPRRRRRATHDEDRDRAERERGVTPPPRSNRRRPPPQDVRYQNNNNHSQGTEQKTNRENTHHRGNQRQSSNDHRPFNQHTNYPQPEPPQRAANEPNGRAAHDPAYGRDGRLLETRRPADGELSIDQIERFIFRRYRPPMNMNQVHMIPQPEWMSDRHFNHLLNIEFPDRTHWDHARPLMLPLGMLRDFYERMKSTRRPAFQDPVVNRLHNQWMKTPVDERYRWIMWMNPAEWAEHVARHRIDYMDSPWKAKNTLRTCYDHQTGKRVPVSYLIMNARGNHQFTIQRLYQQRRYDARTRAHIINEVRWVNYTPYDPVEWYRVAGAGHDVEIMMMWREHGRPSWEEFLKIWKRETERGRFQQR